MTLKAVAVGESDEQEIATLIEVLRETGRRLEELTGNEVDTATDPEGRTLLLRGTREQLEQNELTRQAAILNALPAHIALLDSLGTIVSVNDSWRLFGEGNSMRGARKQGVGVNYLAVCDSATGPGSQDARVAAEGIRSVLNGSKQSFSFEYDCTSPSEELWYQLSVTPLSKDVPKGVIVKHGDVTASKRDQSSLASLAQRLSLATEVAKVGVWEWDVASDVLTWDETMCAIYGFPPGAPMPYGKWSAAVYPEDLPEVELKLQRAIDQRTDERAEFRITASDGSLRYISAAERAVVGPSGAVCRVIGVNLDVTEHKLAEEELRRNQAIITHQAEHDFLTGLPNQRVLRDRLDQATKLAARNQQKIAVLFLDLDGFKHINDSLGHAIGDKLLQSTAERLEGAMRASDTLSRFGGDEFVMLLPEVAHPEGTAAAAVRLLEAVGAIHSVGEHELQVSLCIGVSVYPDDGSDGETLIKNADTAMYHAKGKGGGHPVRGSIPPSAFIPVAEDCGLILPIGQWVLEEACRQARKLLDAGLPKINFAVNVSGRQFQSDGFEEQLMATIDQFNIDPEFVELEVTESMLMKAPEVTASLLQRLRAKGVRVAIDDFGTGYSSLSYLHRFPFDSLKIDQSFVRQVSTPNGLSMVKTIIDMGRNLGMRTIAEGVETKQEASILETAGCERAQGYYFSRPLTAANLAALLETSTRASRLSLKTPVVFYFAGGNERGNSVNISEMGMLVEFGRTPEVWLTGQISAQIGECRLSVGVRVVRVDGHITAFAFRQLSDQDRLLIQKLVKEANEVM